MIDRVHELASGSKQQWSSDSSLSFESEPGVKLNEDIQIYNESFYDNNTISHGNIEINDRIVTATGNLNEIESVEDPPADKPTEDSDSTFVPSEDSTNDSEVDEDPSPEISEVNSEDFEFNLANVHDLDNMSGSRSTNTSSLHTYVTESEVIDLTQGPDTPHHSDTSVGGNSFQLMNIGEACNKAIGIMFTQMSASRGIKLFGEKAVSAIFKELKHLNNGVLLGNPAIVHICIEPLTEGDKKKTLEAVNLIKVKRCGKVKGMTCANGLRQRNFVKVEDNFTSPTASLESILTTLVIDAYEGKDVAVADVPGAYLHAKFPQDKKVVLKLTGVFVNIMCSVNPEYNDHVIYEVN